MSDTNTIMGWVLGAGIIALGGGIFFGEVFHADTPETPGYAIEGIESGGGEAAAEIPVAALLAGADAAKGEKIFAKCLACHTINAGGADGVGPNIHGIMGKGIAAGGFAYSSALKDVGGTWGFDNMSDWLKSPKKFAPGNKMSFPGLSKVEERADLLVYMNAQGSNLPLPAAPAAEEGAAEGDAPELSAEQVAEDQATDAAAEAEAAE